jgi:CheY-like chemotaxis protein
MGHTARGVHNRFGVTTFREATMNRSAPPSGQGRDQIWVVDDEPAAAALACDMCELAGLQATAFSSAGSYLGALRGQTTPSAVVLDWRLEHELSAALFMATRQRYPTLPIVFWTGSEIGSLPRMVHHDPHVRVLDKAGGSSEFEAALSWALADASDVGHPAG